MNKVTNNRLLLSTVLLAGSVIGAVNFQTIASADNHNESKCKDYKDALRTRLDERDGKATVKNVTDKCSYEVSLVTYQIFSGGRDEQKVFDREKKKVRAGEEINLKVKVPDCDYQIDLVRGGVIENFDDNRTYHEQDRFLDGKIVNNGKKCDDDKPKSTPTPTVPVPTATPTNKPTVTPTTKPTVTPTNGATPTPENNPTPTLTPVQSQEQTQEQTVNVYNNKVVESEVVTTTAGGQPVYQAKVIAKTPDTGAESLAYLSLIPSSLAGLILRRKVK